MVCCLPHGSLCTPRTYSWSRVYGRQTTQGLRMNGDSSLVPTDEMESRALARSLLLPSWRMCWAWGTRSLFPGLSLQEGALKPAAGPESPSLHLGVPSSFSHSGRDTEQRRAL